MHSILVAMAAAEEVDPATVRPSPLASVVFTLLLVALVLLLWSFLRHMRRVDDNLGSARKAARVAGPRTNGDRGPGRADAPGAAGGTDAPGPQRSADPGTPGRGEGDSR